MTKELWISIIDLLTKTFLPFIISFLISYFIYPLTSFFIKKTNKTIGILLTIICALLFLILIIFLIGPIIYKESVILIYSLIKTLTNISIKYNINLNNYLDILLDYFFNNKIDIFNISYNFITNLIMIIILSIYFLVYMDKIRILIKNIFYKYKDLLKKIDVKITNYSKSCIFTSIITFFEYLFFFLLIRHNEAILLAFLAAILNIIPVFGGIINGALALILATQISKELVIKTIIIVVICSIIDSYVINPIMCKKSNNLNPFITIIGIIIFSKLFGIMGVVLALPLIITIKEIFYYFK